MSRDNSEKKYLYVVEIKKWCWNFEKDIMEFDWLPSDIVRFTKKEAEKAIEYIHTPEMLRVKKYKR